MITTLALVAVITCRESFITNYLDGKRVPLYKCGSEIVTAPEAKAKGYRLPGEETQ